MRRRHTTCRLTLVLLLLAIAASAEPETVVIAGGVRGRTYHDVYAANLMKLLPGFKTELRTTQGSGENLDLLADGRADLGFAQLDVLAARLRDEGKRYGKIGIIGRLADECLVFAYRKEGRVTRAQDLTQAVEGRKPILAIGEIEGGMSSTWYYVTQLAPAYGAAATRFTAGTLAINHLAAGMIDAVGWITDPSNRDHKLLRAVRADPSLGVFGLADASLVHALPGGAPVYELRKIDLGGAGSSGEIETLCTSSVLLSGSKAEKRVVDAASDVLSLQREKLLRRP